MQVQSWAKGLGIYLFVQSDVAWQDLASWDMGDAIGIPADGLILAENSFVCYVSKKNISRKTPQFLLRIKVLSNNELNQDSLGLAGGNFRKDDRREYDPASYIVLV